MFALDGKTAIVTGATGGLGSAMVWALAKADAAIVSIELPDDPYPQPSISSRAVLVPFDTLRCDLRDSARLRDSYRRMWDAGIVPDILANCAGVVRRTPYEDTSDEDINLFRKLPCRKPLLWHRLMIYGNAGFKYQRQSLLRVDARVWPQADLPRSPRENDQHFIHHLLPSWFQHQHLLYEQGRRTSDDQGF